MKSYSERMIEYAEACERAAAAFPGTKVAANYAKQAKLARKLANRNAR